MMCAHIGAAALAAANECSPLPFAIQSPCPWVLPCLVMRDEPCAIGALLPVQERQKPGVRHWFAALWSPGQALPDSGIGDRFLRQPWCRLQDNQRLDRFLCPPG